MIFSYDFIYLGTDESQLENDISFYSSRCLPDTRVNLMNEFCCDGWSEHTEQGRRVRRNEHFEWRAADGARSVQRRSAMEIHRVAHLLPFLGPVRFVRLLTPICAGNMLHALYFTSADVAVTAIYPN